jgi:hypothetical protein
MSKIHGIILQLHISLKTDLCMNECTCHMYDFGQPRLILLASCTRITYDYNTIGINEAFISHFFAITLQLLYWIFM